MKRFLPVAIMTMSLLTGLTTTKAQPPALAQTQTQAPTQDAPAKADGIAGKWHFVLDTQGGDREVEAEFTVDSAGKVTGTFGKAAVAGTFKDGKLELAFNFTSEEAGTTDQMQIVGKLDTATLSGNWQFSSYDGSFTATRPK